MRDARVFITATTTAETAIEAVKQGAFDYLFKPVDLKQLTHVVGQALELGRLMRVPAVVAENPPDDVEGDAIIGRCPAMREVYKAIGRVADQNVIVLITGESGTGKELVARAIYQHGSRAKAAFLAINCAAIRKTCWKASFSATKRGLLPGPIAGGSASSSSPTAARFSSTRLATCRWPRRAKCCGCCRTKRSSASAETKRSTPTSA